MTGSERRATKTKIAQAATYAHSTVLTFGWERAEASADSMSLTLATIDEREVYVAVIAALARRERAREAS